MTWRDSAVAFDCDQDQLIGVASLPFESGAVGVVIVVGGPQYRAGSHRQFVSTARCFAAAGYPVLRFDCRGMGDSGGARRSFEHIGRDIGAAVDALQRLAPGVRKVVLWGLCDGASAALLYRFDHPEDTRIAGLCLLNPWVRTEVSLAKTQIKHYYVQRLTDPEFWRKLARGAVAFGALREFFRHLARSLPQLRGRPGAAAPPEGYTRRMSAAWKDFAGHILLILSGRDYTAMEFVQTLSTDPDWSDAQRHPHFEQCSLPAADHTLSAGDERQRMEQHCLRWMATIRATPLSTT